MTEPRTEQDSSPPGSEHNASLFELGAALLRRRRLLTGCMGVGAIVGFLYAFMATRQYPSSATFLPQSNQQGAAGFALAANQLGISLPTSSGFWVSGIFVELLRSRTLLQPLAQETFTVEEDGGRTGTLMDLLEVKGSSPAVRLDRAVRLLQSKVVTSNDDRRLGTVKLTARTQWPSLSKAVADALVKGVNDFNLQTRKSQASAERQFVEGRLIEAGRELRAAENDLQAFLLRNRILASPVLAFDRDRLQREVTVRQQVYTTLVQSREDARIREVRDTPVITVIDSPLVPQRPESRRVIFFTVLGFIAGAGLGGAYALGLELTKRARAGGAADAQTFFSAWDEAVAGIRRILRRR
jgi:uncharacterized protein involved in exopolysaccharide biosynthesis